MTNEITSERRGILARAKAYASTLVRKHGPEVGAIAKIAAHTLLPGGSILVGAVEATCDYAADKGRDLNQDESEAAMTRLLEELGADVAQLESLLGHLTGQLDGVLGQMVMFSGSGASEEMLTSLIHGALEHQFSALRDEFRALMPELETVKRQGAQMLRQQAIQGDMLNQVQDQLSAALAFNAPLASEGVVGPQVSAFLGARGRFQSALLNGDLEGAARDLEVMKALSPNGNTYRVNAMALQAARRDFVGAERTARTITGAGADDPRVRRAITSLTALTRGVARGTTQRALDPQIRSTRYEVGVKIGDQKWELTALLGRGGMGSVWRARNRFGREGAVKLMSAELSIDAGFISRFRAEIDALDRVNHSAVIDILDWGQDQSDVWYFVMPFIEGHSLRSRLTRGVLSSDEVRSIASDLAAGLVACHAQGVVHRDIKPENIMLKASGAPILIDFGIAHQEDASTGQTHLIMRSGTPKYAPPEQMAGERTDHSADLYALGVTLEECLGSSAMDETWSALIDQMTHRHSARRGTARDLLEWLSPRDAVTSGDATSSGDAESIARAELERAERMMREAMARAEEEARVEASHAERSRATEEEVTRAARIRKLNAQREAFELTTRHLNGDLDASAFRDVLEVCMREGPLTRDELPDVARTHLRAQRSAGDLVISRIKDMEFKMIYCPAGEFWMGSDEKLGWGSQDHHQPRHHVKIARSFLIGQTQVTQAQWSMVLGTDPSHFKGSHLPVENVSWLDCICFCNALSELAHLEPVYDIESSDTLTINLHLDRTGYRLPTEAEWEYMAKAETELIYAGSNDADEVAWYSKNSSAGSHPVAQKRPNAWGIYDCSGNVWEWCSDRWNTKSLQSLTLLTHDLVEQVNSTAPRVFRGGGWDSIIASRCRVASRGYLKADRRGNNLSFRLLRCES